MNAKRQSRHPGTAFTLHSFPDHDDDHNDCDDDFDDDLDDDDVVDFVIIRERFGEALFARIVGQGVVGHLRACLDRCFPDQDRYIVIINIVVP